MTGPLLFEPLYQPRVWGGRALGEAFDRALPAGRIGESWEVADRPRERSTVRRGPFAGQTLRRILEERGAAVMGAPWDPARPFPILVKWLDCRERLSLQVHPPQAVASSLGGEPKTENWYIARADAGAGLIAGLKRGVTRAEFTRALADGALETLVHRMPVSVGDSMFVRSGRIHAIDAGNLILEIQQNSDTTYRVYDWGRVGEDGRPRQLHVEASLRCIDFEDFEPAVTHATGDDAVLAECPEFRIRRARRAAGARFPVTAQEPRLVSVVEGIVDIEHAGGRERYGAGDNVLLPADTEAEVRAGTPATVLLTDAFGG